jgi:hypothetical protein
MRIVAAYGRWWQNQRVSSNENEWYWDLDKKVAIPAADRGPGDNTLGPYPSKFEAQNWKLKSDERNEAWNDDGQPPASGEM